ncbi:exodeoxyribonuclease III [Rickettsiales bacterium]|nr:exodeoxyribonuclease III [Rickettsiales bacterium]
MKIATWNINSVRLRINIVLDVLKQNDLDILCLQETKVEDNKFPLKPLHEAGYIHTIYRGQRSYNGVCIISRIPLDNVTKLDFAGKQDDARHIGATLPNGLEIHNFYIPAGGDEPDVEINPKFKHKLDFVDDITKWFKSNRSANDNLMIMGDFNIAPLEHDVWSHKQLLKVVSHTPIEVEKLNKFKESISWIDVGRFFIPENEKSYSWWSYRNRDWRKSNRGRRLDHIWVTPKLEESLHKHEILSNWRDVEKPSDHVPLIITIK